MVELDERDYRVAIARAEAELAQAQAQLAAGAPQVPITSTSTEATVSTSADDIVNARAAIAAAERDYQSAVAKLHEAEANDVKARTDRARAEQLIESRAIPREQYDNRVAAANATKATVQSNRALGARFSLLPPENATGNYVKVVQRVPVRIALDPTKRRPVSARACR